MPEPKFVIVGTGRSGSTYISKLLTNAGIPCGGESWWNPRMRRDDRGRWDHRPIVGDSSCCALAQGLDGYEGMVFHQIRHPLDVIRSYIRSPVTEPHLSIFQKLIPDADRTDVLGFAMRFWLASAETAELYTNGGWWRPEQIGPDLIHQIANLIDMPIGRNDVVRAFQNTRINPYSYSQDDPQFTWERPTWERLAGHDAKLTEQIQEVAARYGLN